MNKPKISILVPVYLSFNFLNKVNIEIIYINDGSPDDSGKICDQFAANDQRIKVIHQKNSGAAEALNTGILNSTGEFIMFIDADDWIELNTCEIAIKHALENDADLVFWMNIKEYETKSVPYPPFFTTSKLFKGEEMVFLKRRMMGLIGNELKFPIQTDAFNAGWGKMYKTKIIKDNHIKWNATHLVGSSDVLFNAKLMPYINRAFFLKEYLHHYNRNNPNSLTRTYNNTLYSKYKNLFNELNKIIGNFYPKQNDFVMALNNRIAMSSINITLSLTIAKYNKQQYLDLSKMLHDGLFIESFKKLEMQYLPIHFKCFFYFARLKFTFGILVLGKIMNKMR